jgi:glutathione S-transferase
MLATVEQVSKLRVTRLIKAPRERVFAAWTTPADVLKWFSPETCRVLAADIDLRTGGKYHFRVQSETFGEVDLRGDYREVRRPSKLFCTWKWSGNPKLEFGESQVTVDFLDRGGSTEVQITHECLPSEEIKEDHKQGWTVVWTSWRSIWVAARKPSSPQCP